MSADVTRLVRRGRAHGVWSALGLGLRASLQHRWVSVAFFAASVGQAALQGALVWALREVLIYFSAAGGVTVFALAWAAGAIFLLWTARAAATFAGEMFSVHLAHRVEIAMMLQVIAKLLTLPVAFFDRHAQSDLVLASYHDLKGIRAVTLDVGNITLYMSRLLALLVVAFLLSPKLAFIGVVLVPLGALPAYWLGTLVTDAARKERLAVMTLYDSFLQVSSGIRWIKVNRTESQNLRTAERSGKALFDHTVKQARGKNVAKLLLEAMSGLGLIAVLVVGGRDVGAGTLDWQSLMSLLIAVMAVYGPMVGLLQVYGRISSVIPNLDRVDAILSAEPELADSPNARPLVEPPRTIAFDDVTFGYDGTTETLRGLTATFHRGERIGIVGASGVGKSTFLALLLRFYDPTRGRILLDGVDLREIRHADLMDRCAIVLQEPFLLSDTVANNIRAARPEATMEEVVEAAKAANVHDEIMLMPDGYETVLGRGQDARGVSVGQKQRICIAGALLKNAPILLLDEATSALDPTSERAVQGAIDRLMDGRTTFMITHRLDAARSADRILVLADGGVAGLGTHEELLRDCGPYRCLWQSQRSDGFTAATSATRGNGAGAPVAAPPGPSTLTQTPALEAHR